MKTIARAALSIGAAALVAGCGTLPLSLSKGQGDMPPIGAPDAMPQSSRSTVPAGSAQLLYVTEYARSAVLVYDTQTKSPKPKARITIGLNEPSGDCIDDNGTLYVVDSLGWISEYPRGERRPIRIIRRGVRRGSPAYCAIDSEGDLWVTQPYVERYYRRSGPCLTEYKPGSKKPFTIITRGLSDPLGIAIDGSGNIYVANRTTTYAGNVLVYPPGGKTPARTITDGVTSPIGIGVDASGTLYVANFRENDVEEYPAGASAPYKAITQGLDGPAAVTLNQQGWLYVANDENSTISEYPPGSITPSKHKISKGLYNPQGLAYYPALLP
jgi:serine/threonine protein kinase, bacterial